jgi:hypothetical protein
MKQSLTIAVAGAALSSACWAYDSPTAPTPALPAGMATVPEVVTVTGVVYEVTAAGRRPLADVGIDMSHSFEIWPPEVWTDGEGRFVLRASASALEQKLVAYKEGYSQPCRRPVEQATAEHDIHLVRNDLLTRAGMPAPFPVVGTMVNGTVFEQHAHGRQPVSGAAVTLDTSGGLGWAPAAQTRTGPDGGFVLCNVGATRGVDLVVVRDGYRDLVQTLPTTLPDALQIELRPR